MAINPSSLGLNLVNPTGTIATDNTVCLSLDQNLDRSRIDFSSISLSLISGHTTIWACIYKECFSNHLI